jgi:endonuclease/exonuclease/phosphatase family metal-dependent hydrolase
MCTNNIEKLATYRIDKTIVNREHELTTNKTHAQINYILTERRWRNTITNVESDTRANIYSDHFPLTFTTNIKLKAIPKGGKVDQCTNLATPHKTMT